MGTKPVKVKGRGNPEARVLMLGDKPGKDELRVGRVFVGRVGVELDKIMWKTGVSQDQVWIDNLLADEATGEDWAVTEDDLSRNRGHIDGLMDQDWAVIVTMGTIATRYLLGDVGPVADIYTVHGVPHRVDDVTIFPTVHPAAGFSDTDAYPYIVHDFNLLAAYLNSGWVGPDRVDRFETPRYEPLTDRDTSFIRHLFERKPVDYLSIDTESNGWMSFSGWNSEGYVIDTRSAPAAFKALATAVDAHHITAIMHYAVHDIAELRRFGWDTRGVRILDTMVAAYLLQIEPQGLKNLAYRHCGMSMSNYMDLVSPYSLEKRLDWLILVNETDWGKPEPIITEGKTETKVTQPQGLNRRVDGILKDLGEDPDGVDLFKRWTDIHAEVRGPAEAVHGAMPMATLDDVPYLEAMQYSARDADATNRVWWRLRDKLTAMGLYDTFEMDCAVIPHIEEMQTVGMAVDVPYFRGLVTKWRGEQGRIRKRLADEYLGGRYINPESSAQVAQILFKEWGLPVFKETEGGQPSTADKAIDWLRDRHPGVGLIGRHREFDKGVTSFAEPIIRFATNSPDGRVHTNLKYTRVVSGRFSATEPNLLAMPVRTDLGKDIRAGFVAGDGRLLGSWDFNQVEMRFMAHESQDEDLIKAYHHGADIHNETAVRMFGGRLEDVINEQREIAKRVSFGVITGIQGQGLRDQFYLNGITRYDESDCDNFIKTWFEARRRVKDYLESCRAEARRYGYVRESVGGRIRYLQGVQSTNKKVMAEAERASHSHKISAGAQAILKLAMAVLWPIIEELRRGDGVKIDWVLQVHDEIILEFPAGYEEVLDPIVTDVLCSTVKLRVPIKAKGKWAKNWGGLK